MNSQLLHRIFMIFLAVSMPISAQANAEEAAPVFVYGALAAVSGSPDSLDSAVPPIGKPDPRFPVRVAQSDLYPFDGKWEGEMRTTFGGAPCGTQYRLKMMVSEGAATGSAARGGERFTLYGEINAAGKFTWSATRGRGGASGEGLVDGGKVRGDWEDDTGQCSGTFRIEKIH